MIKIGLDMDGVCANFIQGFADVLEHLKIKPYRKVYKEDIGAWELSPENNFNLSYNEEEKAWNYISQSKNFWYYLSLMDLEGWRLLLSKLANREDIHLYFITARKKGINIFAQTCFWLHKNGIHYPQVILEEDKIDIINALKLDYYIDDHWETIKEVAKNSCLSYKYETKTYILDYPYNRIVDCKGDRIIRVNNLKEYVESIIKENNL